MDSHLTAEPPHLHQRSLNRKLLQTSNLAPKESDPFKAVVLYRPPALPLSLPGRSLTGTNQTEETTRPCKVTMATNSSKAFPTRWQKLGFLSLFLLLGCFSSKLRFYNFPKCDSPDVFNATSVFSLGSKLVGQDAAKDILLNRIEIFLQSNDSILVLLLVGGPGTGKSFTTQSVYNSLNASILKRKILLPLSTKEFLSESHSDRHGCSALRTLFVEDVDSAERWQMQLFIDHLNDLKRLKDGIKTIVFINSSAGQKFLTRLLYEKLESNESRSSLGPEVSHLLSGAIHSEFTDLLDRADTNVTFVPFFPLEKNHVRHCIERELEVEKVLPTTELVEKILDLVRFHPADSQYFAVFGCKNVHTYVNIVLSDVNS